MRARDGAGYIVASDRTSRASRAAGAFTFSCAFFCSGPSPCLLRLSRHVTGFCLQLQLKRRTTVQAPDSRSLPRSIFYTLQKRGRSHLASFAGLLTSVFGRCCNGYPDKPNMSGEGAAVYRAANSPAAHGLSSVGVTPVSVQSLS
jgi:hypothetical protein